MLTKRIIWIMVMPVLLCMHFCSKKNSGVNPSPPPEPQIKPQVDPELATSIGFWMDDWQSKSYRQTASAISGSVPSSTAYSVTVDFSKVVTKIPPAYASDNANIWMGDFSGETVLLNHIKSRSPHLLRFPGGSISDTYFWNHANRQPPADVPPKLVKADGSTHEPFYWGGKHTEDWTIPLDKFYEVLTFTGSQGIFTVNYGYARYGTSDDPVAAAAKLAADWVRYDNGRTKYWEVGNENYGDWEAGYRINTDNNKDGQPELLTGQLYGQHFKVFADSMRQAAREIGKTIYIGAVAYESVPQSWSTNTVRTWNSGMLAAAGQSPDFYVVHNYYTAYHTNAHAAEILASPQTVTREMMTLIKNALTTAGLPQKPVVLDEWNIFSQGSMQQVSNINGLHAVMVLGETLRNQYGMTARWDLANGWDNGNDHGMFNVGDEPGVAKWNPRPAFYYMYYMQKTLGDRLLEASSTTPDIVCYPSSFSSGEMGAAIVNKSATAKNVEIKIENFETGSKYYFYTLNGGDDNGEFSRKVYVNGKTTAEAGGGPSDYLQISPFSAHAAGGIKVNVPAWGAVFLVVEND